MLECLKYTCTTMQKDVLTLTEATTLHIHKHVHIPLPTYVHSYVWEIKESSFYHIRRYRSHYL